MTDTVTVDPSLARDLLDDVLDRDAAGDGQDRAEREAIVMHQFPDYGEHGDASGPGFCVQWQRGPIAERFNGATPEGIIRAVISRLEQFQAGPLRCQENSDAISLLNAALNCLDARTRDRYRRGVMGTSEP